MAILSVWDYVVFASMLVGSSFIGLFYGYKSSKNNENENSDYLLAGRSMGWFPLFVSIVGSFMSAISLLGIPGDVYTYGSMYVLSLFGFLVNTFLCVFIFAPLFRKIDITSANEVSFLIRTL